MYRPSSLLRAIRALALLTALIVPGAWAYPQDDSPSPTEVDRLVEEAQTSEDHLRLAQHYKAEAALLEASADRHAGMGQRYRMRKNLPPKVAPSWRGMARHCSNLAASLRSAAKASGRLAAEHERMAKQLEQ